MADELLALLTGRNGRARTRIEKAIRVASARLDFERFAGDGLETPAAEAAMLITQPSSAR